MDIEAYILIGGRSSRLGRAKAFVEIDGMTLADRALNAVQESGIASTAFFVAANKDQFAMQALQHRSPFIFDLIEGRGPIGGLHAALSNARTERILLMACDHPFVSPEFIRFMAKQICDDFGTVAPIQPDGRVQPLCAFYNARTALPIVNEIIHSTQVSPPMRNVVNALNPRLVRPEEYAQLDEFGQLFTNVNTPGDVRGIVTGV